MGSLKLHSQLPIRVYMELLINNYDFNIFELCDNLLGYLVKLW